MMTILAPFSTTQNTPSETAPTADDTRCDTADGRNAHP
jgi:hypothetical protein